MTETVSESGEVCRSCGAVLTAEGNCLPCLLHAGLNEATVDAPPPGPVIFGDFEISRREDGSLWELGRGAMGVTYRAVDRVLHRAVALKVINVPTGLPHGGAALRERFLREARAAAALRHANVAGVFQFGASGDGGRCYYAMELVEGETLETRVRRDGPLDVETALEIAAQITAALTAASGRGLIHRDLKPGNLMLTYPGDTPASGLEVKVIDFGLAKAVKAPPAETDLTRGGFVGTPAFASPEQFERGPVDARSDFYSLGMTLWYMLTARVPFAGVAVDELPGHPSRLILPVDQLTARKVPAPVVSLLRTLLAVDPDERPATASELTAALAGCRARLGIGRDEVGRTRGVAAALVAALLLLLAAVIASHWFMPGSGTQDRVITDRSIAVLPFDNLSADKENAFFTDGMQEEILTDLARVADLRVVSRTSVMPFHGGKVRNLREITRELGVAHFVEGSVQRTGNSVRVSAKLIDARTDAQEWGEHYDRDLSDVFTIQSEIAHAIAAALQARLSPSEKAALDRPPTTNVAAYDAYLQGKKLLRDAELTHEETDIREAGRRLEEATNRDRQFFQAWCELARANLNLFWYNFDHTPERLARAENAVQTARQLRPGADEAHLAQGVFLYWGHRDFAGAAGEFQAAARLLPNNSEAPFWLGLILRRQGHWEESIRQTERAAALDPRNAQLWVILAETDEMVYRYADAERALDRALALDPQNLQYTLLRADCARMKSADLEPMRRWLRSVSPDNEQWNDTAALQMVYIALDDGDYPAAARALSRYRQPTIIDRGYVVPRAETEGRIAAWNSEAEAAQKSFLAARSEAENACKEHPQDAKALVVLANIDSGLGRHEDAVREARQACAMLPVSADAFDAPYLIRSLAAIHAAGGEHDQAIEVLRSIIRRPAGPSYGELRLEPEWKPLAGDGRFEAMIKSLAPEPGR